FVGKAIYDVRAFQELLKDRVPENSLLSHDLFEGIHCRAGLVSDIVLYESFPPDYLSYATRLHRWVRGDWQLLPWLLGDGPRAAARCGASPLSLLNRWKIFDNLRRSLYAPALLAFFVLGWLVLPGNVWAWTAIGVALSLSNLFSAGLQLLPDMLRSIGAEHTQQPLSQAARRWLLGIIFLPYEAYLAVDAILKTVIRVYVTHRHMLQWTTAAHTASLLGKRTSSFVFLWIEMASSTLSAIGIAAVLLFLRPAALPAAVVFLLLWFAAPLIAALISKPITSDIPPLTQDQRVVLRHLARRTWHYFVDFIIPEDHWLPPDHFQEMPKGTVAHRTSPTNLGMALLSMMAAYDLGFITLNTLLIRLGNTLNAMDKLDRFRGHFLNWYDTRTLAPLPPRYVSTVDSGNLVACLITLRQGLDGLINQPVLRPEEWLGLIDTLETVKETSLQSWVAIGAGRSDQMSRILESMQETLRATAYSPATWSRSLERLIEQDLPAASSLISDLISEKPDALRSKQLNEIETWLYHVGEELEDLEHSLDQYMPWGAELDSLPQLFDSLDSMPDVLEYWQELYEALQDPPQVSASADFCSHCLSLLDHLVAVIEEELGNAQETGPSRQSEQLLQAIEWCQRVARHVEPRSLNTERLFTDLQSLSQSSRNLSSEVDFAFLFDQQRKVFRIGYNLDTVSEDPNHYDLLASEARLASIVAIARGEVPQDHWIHLARPITRVNGVRALLSWSGTMFEYLMPALLMRSSPGTLIAQTNQAVVTEQINYAMRRGTPWGISESGYYRFDNAQNYQYQAFGVPTLAFKRGLRSHHVITPYASLLALPYHPEAVLENVIRLQRQGMLGVYGLYEAADYTRRQIPPGRRFGVVQSYMVHHQAMSLIAITNALHQDVMVSRFMSDPRIQAIQLLLEERVPFQAPLEFPEQAPAPVRQTPDSSADVLPSWQPDSKSPVPETHVLSNGQYGLIITASGAGYSTWNDTDLTRWRPDTTRDSWGSWIYIKDHETGSLWSATRQPTPSPTATYETSYHTHMAEFVCRNNGLSVRTEVLVSPGHDVEIRRVSISNDTDRHRSISLLDYAEVTLARPGDDERHQAFTKLFVESEYIAEVNGLLFRRRPRSAQEESVFLLHSLVPPPDKKPTRTYDTDRNRFLGRGGSIGRPAALAGDRPALTKTTGATLDPIIALGQDIELEPHSSTRIAFVTAAAEFKQQALDLTQQLNTWTSIDQIFTHSQLDFDRGVRQMGLDSTQVTQAQKLLSFLLYPVSALRTSPRTIASNTLCQSGLWGFAVSGDYPIALVLVHKKDEMSLIREMLAMHAFWRSRGIKIDLIIVNEREEGYDQELHRQMLGVLAETHSDEYLNQRGGV
ncbi:MAG: cyclic beta 1-2 glucan synthetase, partial [Anaerolineae bacterium]|nr:cyclic beta 1-2 glucan synthetase [Anaerolineae bacterium]